MRLATSGRSGQKPGMNRICLCLCLSCSTLLAGVRSPDDRVITEPRSVESLANPAAHPLPIDTLFYSRSVSGPTWSPDGKEIAFTTNLTGRPNLWKVAATGGWPVQLLQSDDRQTGAIWSPDGKWIAYQQDKAGNELYEILAVPANGGEPVNLTHTDDVSETAALWSKDGAMLAFAAKRKIDPNSNICVLDMKSHQLRALTAEKSPEYSWTPAAWSADGRFLLAQRGQIGATDSDVYLLTVATGAAENLTPHQGKTVYTAADISPDGSTVLLGSNEKYGVGNAALLDLATKKLTWVTDLQWEATPGEFAPDGRSFTYTVNEDGRTELYLVSRGTLQAEKLAFPEGLPGFAGRPNAFSPDGRQLLVSHQSSQRPSDLWIYDLAGRASRQLTVSTIAGLDPASIPPSQLVHYRSFDGMIISAFLWVPYNLKRDGTNPGIVLPHGGPTGQTVDSFNRTVAALSSRGYVVIAPNVRGSTGYGMAFQKANYADLGGGDLKDEVFAAQFLTASGYVHSKRVGITGGSYGGFMTLMAVGRTPGVWAAGVESYGIINWFTMYEHEDAALQQYQRSLMGDPVTDRAVYVSNSPLTYLGQVTAPLLVLQGDNDIRVPKEEAVQIVDILSKAGKTVDAHYYPNEGHGFVKRENQIDAIKRTIEWFDRHLKLN